MRHGYARAGVRVRGSRYGRSLCAGGLPGPVHTRQTPTRTESESTDTRHSDTGTLRVLSLTQAQPME
jgi:hypothetical protein